MLSCDRYFPVSRLWTRPITRYYEIKSTLEIHSILHDCFIVLLLSVKTFCYSFIFQITQMTRLIKEEFINGLETLSWMSPLTRANAREKVRLFVAKAKYMWYVIYQTRETVFHHISKNQEESWKYDAYQSIFDEICGVCKSDKPLSRVFYIFSQSKQQPLRSKRRNIIVKTCAHRPFPSCLFPLFHIYLFLRDIDTYIAYIWEYLPGVLPYKNPFYVMAERVFCSRSSTYQYFGQ